MAMGLALWGREVLVRLDLIDLFFLSFSLSFLRRGFEAEAEAEAEAEKKVGKWEVEEERWFL
jgi:hypothetical protein